MNGFAGRNDPHEMELDVAGSRAHTMDDAAIPTREHQPPYSEDFIAHLHAGAYRYRQDHDQLWCAVRADPDANYILITFSKVTDALRELKAMSTEPDVRARIAEAGN